MALKVEVISDVSKVLADTATMADRFDDVADTLKDLAQEGDRAGDKLEKSFKDGVTDRLEKGFKDAEAAAKDLGTKADSAFDQISADARKAGKDVGKSQKDGFKEAEGGLKEFGDEANSTAKESAASFDGSADSILGSFQEIAANAFAGFGPAGAAAGLAVAAGLGIAISAAQELGESNTEAKQRAVDMIDAIADAGGNLAELDLSEKIKTWGREVLEDNWITFWANEATTKFQETAKDAKAAGVEIRDAIRAGAGSADDSRKFLEGTADDWARLTKEIDRGTSTTEAGLMVQDDHAKKALAQRNALSDLRGQAEENIKTTGDAIDIYNIEADALDATKEAAEKAAQAIQEKADASDRAADSALDVVGAENDWITTLAQMEKDIKGNAKTLDVHTAAGRANRESLVEIAEAANTYRDAQIAAGGKTAEVTATVQEQRDAFIRSATAITGNADEAAKLADKYGLIPGNVETLVKANGTEEAKAAIEAIPEAKNTDVAVNATGTAETQGAIDSITGKDAAVAVSDDATVDATQARIDAIAGRDLVKIDVDDDYTVKAVQDRINGIQGRDVYVNLKIGNEWDFLGAVSRLTAPRTQYVNLVPREGQAATP